MKKSRRASGSVKVEEESEGEAETDYDATPSNADSSGEVCQVLCVIVTFL